MSYNASSKNNLNADAKTAKQNVTNAESTAKVSQFESPIVGRMTGDDNTPLRWRGMEQLEERMLMSVSMNEAGWTVITPEEDSRIIYVSSSRGSDNNSGYSENQAVKTIEKAKSLVRDNSADQILLRRGDVWYESFGKWTKSGRSADARIVIGAYGNANERPELRTGFDTALWTSSKDSIDNLAIIGVHFYAHKRDPDGGSFQGTKYADGIHWRASGENLLIEDVKIESYGMNLMMQSASKYHNFDLRRSVIVDAYSASGHSHGMYMEYFYDVTLEGNLFDHNGWNPKVNGAHATIFNHNIYAQVTNSPVIARNNVFARGSATGIQMRSGGVAENNLFIANPTGMDFGFVIGAASPDPNGTSGLIKDNVFMYGTDIAAHQPRGMGLKLGNIGQAEIANNLFVDDKSDKPYGWAMALHGENGIGLKNLNIHDNTTYNWRGGFQVRAGTYKNINIENNTLQQHDGESTLMYIKDNGTLRHFDIKSNDYYSTRNSSRQFRLENSEMSFSDWKQKTGDTGGLREVDFYDENRTAESYSKIYGGKASVDGFLRLFRENSSFHWNTAFTAESFNEYMRQGFNMSESPEDTRPVVTVAATADADENGRKGRFKFTRSGDVSKVLEVEYTLSGSATNGSDFKVLTGKVRFEKGASTATIDIEAIDDSHAENRESVTLTLANGSQYRAGANNSATVDIVDNDGGPIDDNPTGNAEIVISDTSGDPTNLLLGLATTEVGQSSYTEHFDIRNSGNGDLEITNFAINGAAGDFDIKVFDGNGNSVTGNQFTIGAGETYRVEVTFVPTTHGARVATINFDTNDLTGGEETIQLQVAGEGVAADAPTGSPEIDIADSSGDPRNLTLGLATTEVGDTSFPGHFTLRNSGDDVLLIRDLQLTGAAAGDFNYEILDANGQVVTGDLAIDPGEAYQINVWFTPTQAGDRVANITFTTNDLTDGEESVSLQVAGLGEAAATPVYEITDTSNDPTNRTLGLATTEIGKTSYPGQFVIRNTGGAALEVSQFGLTGEAANEFVLDVVDHNGNSIVGRDFKIAAGESVTINARFAPTKSGSRVAQIEFFTNESGVSGTPVQLKLAGLGTGGGQAEIDITDTTNDKTNLIVGMPTTEVGQTSRVEQFKIRNAGNAPLSITDFTVIGAAAGDFDVVVRNANGQVVDTDAFTVAAGDTWQVEVTFRPTTFGDRLAEITFNTNDTTDDESTVLLSIAGLGTQPTAEPPAVGILGGPSDEELPNGGGGVNNDIMPSGRFEADAPLSIKDARGQDVVFSIIGEGYGEVVTGDHGFASLILHDTNSETQVLISTAKGVETALTNVTVNGSLDRFVAVTTDLYGEMTVTGSVNELRLDDTLGAQNRISIGQSEGQSVAMNLRLDEVNNLDVVTEGHVAKAKMNDVRNSSWQIGGNVQSFAIAGQAEQFELVINGNARAIKLGAAASANVTVDGKIGIVRADHWDSGSLQADRIGVLRTSRANGDFGAKLNVNNSDEKNTAVRVINLGGAVSGDWQVNGNIRDAAMQTTTDAWHADIDGRIGSMDVEGDAAGALTAHAIRRFNIGGDMDQLDLQLTDADRARSLRRLDVGGAIDGVTINTASAIGTVDAAAMRDSNVTSGLLANNDFDAISSIDRLIIRGDTDGRTIDSSSIQARRIKEMQIADAALTDEHTGLRARAEQIDRLQVGGDDPDESNVIHQLVNADIRLI